jgi:hypothetical protein
VESGPKKVGKWAKEGWRVAQRRTMLSWSLKDFLLQRPLLIPREQAERFLEENLKLFLQHRGTDMK